MKNVLDDLYFEINPKEKKILSIPKELENNWKTICGLRYLSQDELFDFSWVGYYEEGFLKFCKENEEKLKQFTVDATLFNSIKCHLKDIVSSLRYEIECSGVIVDNRYEISTDDRSKTMIQLKYLECISNDTLNFKWKTKSGFVDFTSADFIKMTNQVQKFFQNLFNIEFDICNKIEESKSILDLLSIFTDEISWTSNSIKI